MTKVSLLLVYEGTVYMYMWITVISHPERVYVYTCVDYKTVMVGGRLIEMQLLHTCT